MAELAPLGVLNGFSEEEQQSRAEVLSEASTSGQDSEIENKNSCSYIFHKVRAPGGGAGGTPPPQSSARCCPFRGCEHTFFMHTGLQIGHPCWLGHQVSFNGEAGCS